MRGKTLLLLIVFSLFAFQTFAGSGKLMKGTEPDFQFECPNDWECSIQNTKNQMLENSKRPPRDYSDSHTPLTGSAYKDLMKEMAKDSMEDAVQESIQKQMVKHYQKQMPTMITIYLEQENKSDPATLTVYITESKDSGYRAPKFNCRQMMKSQQSSTSECKTVECNNVKWDNKNTQVMTTRCKSGNNEWTYSTYSNFRKDTLNYSLSGEQTISLMLDDCPAQIKAARNQFMQSFNMSK